MWSRTYAYLLLIIVLSILFRIYLVLFLFPVRIISEQIFILQLFSIDIIIPIWIIFLIGLGNLILLWLIGNRLFNNTVGLVTALLYAISPWTAYSEAAGSIYVVVLCGLLISAYGLLQSNNKYGILFIVFGILLSLYLSLTSWFVIPWLIIGIFKQNYLSRKRLVYIS